MTELLKLKLPKGESLLPPENIGNYFDINNKGKSTFVVDIGLPRISSTARAVLLGSGNTGVNEVHFQPWKYIQRYALQLKSLGEKLSVIINPNGDGGIIFLKETPGGPNDEKELFDPVETLLQKGVSPSQIKVMLGIREPYSQFQSWIKFDQERQSSLYLEGLKYLLGLIDSYEEKGITVVPFVFELFYPNASEYWNWIINQLDLKGKIFLPENLLFSPDPRVIWHEADPKLNQLPLNGDVGTKYFEKVIKPVIKRGRFEVPPPNPLKNQFPNDEHLKEAKIIYFNQANFFYKLALTNGLSMNKPFENFLNQYGG